MSEVAVTPVEPSPAYTDDYYLWWERQLELMQAGRWGELDFHNVTDEFRDLGVQHRHAAESFIEQMIVHLIAIDVCSSNHLVRAETIVYWKKEIRSFRRNLLKTLANSPGLKSVLAKDYPRLWKYSLSSLLSKVEDIETIDESRAREIVKPFDQSPYFSIEECVGFDLNKHKRSMTPYDYEGKWLYPAGVRDAIERAEKNTERRSRAYRDDGLTR